MRSDEESYYIQFDFGEIEIDNQKDFTNQTNEEIPFGIHENNYREFMKSSYQFRLRSTDLGGLSYEQSFIWDVDSNTVQKNDPITGSSFTLDVDKNGTTTALGDGLMIIRKLFGSAFAGDALTDKAISDNATRTTDEIHEYIQSGIDSLALDVDKNGKVSALGDGLMIVRKLFGSAFAGDALIDKAISNESPYYGKDNASQMVADNIDSLLI